METAFHLYLAFLIDNEIGKASEICDLVSREGLIFVADRLSSGWFHERTSRFIFCLNSSSVSKTSELLL